MKNERKWNADMEWYLGIGQCRRPCYKILWAIKFEYISFGISSRRWVNDAKGHAMCPLSQSRHILRTSYYIIASTSTVTWGWSTMMWDYLVCGTPVRVAESCSSIVTVYNHKIVWCALRQSVLRFYCIDIEYAPATKSCKQLMELRAR